MATDLDLVDNAPGASPKERGGSALDEPFRPIGRYLLLKRIARGGMGEVFLASTMGLEGAERPVVVKIIRREHAKDPSFIARFLDEARVQAQLQHSGVAQVLDAAIDDRTGEPYAVVEHVEGRSLGELRSRAIQQGRAIDWADAVALATLIAEALAHVHERRGAGGRALAIVHRDLSPQNVMVSYAGDVKIIDFGTARGMNRRCHTVAGVVFAKPGYVAPEVANGDSGDARVDLYALGIMLWELCSGRRFLQGDANVHMAEVARNARNPPPIAAQVGAPSELDHVIERLTAFDREARYAPGPEAARALARLLGDAPELPNGERGVRARAAALLQTLFPGEPNKTQGEFARLIAEAREARSERATPVLPKDAQQKTLRATEEGLLPGTRYRLGRVIGKGSSSVVHEAEHVDLGRKVALKLLAPAHSLSEEFAARFRREARALSHLSHASLVEVYDCGVSDLGQLFCAMELLEGETLEARIEREGALSAPESLRLASLVLSALEVAHEAGVIHRDIKPANLFLTADGGLKILDFGLAKSPEGFGAASFASERMGFTIFGTPEYMAPEQAASGQVDARADLYSLGCVLYELLSGRLPFVGESSIAILDAKIKGSPERLRDRAPAQKVPVEVDDLVMRALARHPSVRFQSATEMRASIEALRMAPERARSRRRAAGFVTLVAVMGLAGLIFVGKARGVKLAVPAWMHRTSAAAVAVKPVDAAKDPAAVAAAAAMPAGASANAEAAGASGAVGATEGAGGPKEDPAVALEDDDQIDDFVDDTPEVVDDPNGTRPEPAEEAKADVPLPAPALAAAPAAPVVAAVPKAKPAAVPHRASEPRVAAHPAKAAPTKTAAVKGSKAAGEGKVTTAVATNDATAEAGDRSAVTHGAPHGARSKAHHKHKARAAKSP